MDRHSRTLQHLQQCCRLAVQGRPFSLYQTNAMAKPGIRLCPTDCGAIRRAHFWCTCKATYPFPALRKSTIVPLLREAGTNLLLFQEEGKSVLFLTEKNTLSFCNVTKGTKNTEKGRGIPLPFSLPYPLTAKDKQLFWDALSLQKLQDI